MEPIISINPGRIGNYYAIFYLLAFLAGFVLLMWEGKKKKYPTIQWMLVIVTAFLFFIVGCRLAGFSFEDWIYVFRLESIPHSTTRSVLGGILLSIPGILLAKKFLRFHNNVMDEFALVLPLALIIQRFGCLIAGCCFGTTTSMPWAVQYGINSHAFVHQVDLGLISPESKFALPVHPVQLYEVVCCLFIMIVLIHLRKVMKAQGNLFLTSIGLYGVVRFFLEFARGSRSVEDSWFSLTGAQLAIVLILPVLFLVIYKREKTGVNSNSVQLNQRSFYRPIVYLFVITCFFVLVSRWLNKTETLALNIVLVPIFVTIFWHLFKHVTVPQYRVMSLGLPFLALILMSQTLPDSVNSKPNNSSYSMISVGLIGGYSDVIYGDDYNDDCFDSGSRTVHSNDYKTFAFGYSHTAIHQTKSITWGLNLAIIDHEESSHSDRIAGFPDEVRQFSGVAFSPYGKFDFAKFGFGLGFHFGKFSSILPVEEEEFSSVTQRNLYPAFSIRGGDRTKFYAEYKFADQFPSSFPALNHQLYLGFGTTRRDKIWRGGGIKIGTASNAGIFVSTTTAIGETVLLETYIGGLAGAFNPYDHAHSMVGSLSMHVKFGKKVN